MARASRVEGALRLAEGPVGGAGAMVELTKNKVGRARTTFSGDTRDEAFTLVA